MDENSLKEFPKMSSPKGAAQLILAFLVFNNYLSFRDSLFYNYYEEFMQNKFYSSAVILHSIFIFLGSQGMASSYLNPDSDHYKKYHHAALELIRTENTGFVEKGHHGVLITPQDIVTGFHNPNVPAYPKDKFVTVDGQVRLVAYQVAYPGCGVGLNDIGMMHLDKPIENARVANIHGLQPQETIQSLENQELLLLSNRSPVIWGRSGYEIEDMGTHLGKNLINDARLIHPGDRVFHIVNREDDFGQGGNMKAMIRDYIAAPIGGDSFSPAYVRVNNQLKLCGICTAAGDGKERSSGTYTYVGDYIQWIRDRLINFHGPDYILPF